MNVRVLSGLVLIAATAAVANPAMAGNPSPSMSLSNTSGQTASEMNAAHRPSESQVALRSQTRRVNTYRAAYHHKHGTYPSEQQVRTWYEHTYRTQPS
jgi:hypothetical protein